MSKDQVSTRPLIDKLGVLPGARVCVIDVDDVEFLALLKERTGDMTRRLRPKSDIIFYSADSKEQLRRLSQLRDHIVENGAIWVVSRKGKEATIKDTEVIAAAKAAHLVDNKVVAFSPTHTSLRLVIPLAMRS